MKIKDFPYDKIYYASKKESNRKKPVFFVHKYFARRITSNFRASLLSLLSQNDTYQQMFENNSSLGNETTILDPFMGGGTTLFEAQRLGCQSYGNDLQPLSYMSTKALLKEMNFQKVNESFRIIENNVSEKIKKFYKTKCPICGETADSMYYFHVKQAEYNSKVYDLFSSYTLCVKKNIYTVVCPICGEIHKIDYSRGAYVCKCGFHFTSPLDSVVKKGKIKVNNVDIPLTSLVSKGMYPKKTKIIAIEYYCPHCNSHDYKKFDKFDEEILLSAEVYFNEIKNDLPIPNQKIPVGYNTNQILNHGYIYFKDMFSNRQLLCLGLLMNEINSLKDKESQFWLQIVFSGMLEMNNMFCRYQTNAYKICNLFFNHAYVPITMPVENNVWGAKLGTGNFIKNYAKVIRAKRFNNNIYDLKLNDKDNLIYQIPSMEVVNPKILSINDNLGVNSCILSCGDSRKLDHIKDNSVDIVLTDPPYGANVMYSELIDFFHVWNYHSSIADELGFKTPLSPKTDEIVVNEIHKKDFNYYQDSLSQVFKECNNKLKSNGKLVFSFHDKSLECWLSVLGSVYSAGFELYYAVPVHSEAMTGAHTSNKSSIAVDIMLFNRKASQNNKMLTKDVIVSIIEEAIKETKIFIDKLDLINAEMTTLDIKNIIISQVFVKSCGYEIFKENKFEEELVKEIEVIVDKITNRIEFKDFSDKRKNGWWSEQFNNIKKEISK